MRIKKDDILIGDFSKSDLPLMLKGLTNDALLEFYEGCDVKYTKENKNIPFLYQAGLRGIFGKRIEFGRSSITDALFVYLNGETELEAIREVNEHFRNRPIVCLTKAWKELIESQYPEAAVYHRTMMKPAGNFTIPENFEILEDYQLSGMDENAFNLHPFSQGENYSSWAVFRLEGSGAVVYHEGEIVASASSFLTMDGEIELDVSTKEAHRGKKLASACVSYVLKDCMERGFTVHWDAQNDISRHMAQKFGFEIETEYKVYWLPK